MLVKLVILSVVATFVCDAADWDYDLTPGTKTGPEAWPSLGYPACVGKKQSPINIVTPDVIPNDTMGPIMFRNYEVIQNLQLQIINNGHSAQVTPSGVLMSITGGGLPGRYKLWQFHFHWGSTNNEGSEHFIDGQQYALELHLVHYWDRYSSIEEALASNNSHALAVLGFMFDISTYDNPGYVELVKDLKLIQNIGGNSSSVVGATFDIDELFETALGSYYRYEGSLTTPPCLEEVIWTVYEKRLSMSNAQLDTFRNLLNKNDKVIEDNYRHLNPLNDRKVYKYTAPMPTPAGASALTSSYITWSVVIALCALLKQF